MHLLAGSRRTAMPTAGVGSNPELTGTGYRMVVEEYLSPILEFLKQSFNSTNRWGLQVKTKN
jgi:hypothetical protein